MKSNTKKNGNSKKIYKKTETTTMSLNIFQPEWNQNEGYKIQASDGNGKNEREDRGEIKKNEKRVKSIPHNPSHQF